MGWLSAVFAKQKLIHTSFLLFMRNLSRAENFSHREAVRQSGFYTQTMRTLLHAETFTKSSGYTQTHLHTEAVTQSRLYTEQLLHTNAFTHRNSYTENILHANALTQRKGLYTKKKLFHGKPVTQSSFYTRKFFTSSYTEKPLHTGAFTHRGFYMQTPLHTEVFAECSFYTQNLLMLDPD